MSSYPISKTPILILVGPTGSGKSAVGLECARALGAEIISADSRQVYKYLQAGTAKPAGKWVKDRFEVEGVPHHLMDFLDPAEPYNAGLFARQVEHILAHAINCEEKASAPHLSPPGPPLKNHPSGGALMGSPLPRGGRIKEGVKTDFPQFLIVGGTGLYLRALVDGLAPLPPRNDALRNKFNEMAKIHGRQTLHEELKALDPLSAKKIPVNNIARLIRALEVIHLTGKPISWWQENKTTPSQRSFAWFGLRWPSEAYEKNLAERCRKMLKDGLVDETEQLLKRGVSPQAPAFFSLGYSLALAYLKGEIPREELEKRFIHQTRLYAKRQRTWFNANKRITWLDVEMPFNRSKTAQHLLQHIYKSLRPH